MKPLPDSPRPAGARSKRGGGLDWWALAAIFVASLGMRWSLPARIAVEHFDEGVYASNFWFYEADRTEYPDRYLYAPPLLPDLIEWIFVLFGPSNVGAVASDLLAGALTVLLVWWVGRAWFGPAAGLVAACLAALSDIHVLFSRSALTDPLLSGLLLLAVYLLWEAFRRGSIAWSVAAGITTGIAWWTKYNGWLPLPIGLAGLAAAAVFVPSERRRLPRSIVCWLIAAVVAVAVWSPYWMSLRSRGGYAAVMANHRQYLGGWRNWSAALAHQGANLGYLDGLASCMAPALALACVGFLCRRGMPSFTWNPAPSSEPDLADSPDAVPRALSLAQVIPCVAFLFLVTSACGSALAMAVLTLVGLASLVASTWNREGIQIADDGRQLAGWMLAAWFVGLLVATPLYHPYARLTLPWVVCTWIGSGLGIVILGRSLSERFGRAARSQTNKGATWGLAGVIGLMMAAGGGALLSARPQAERRLVPGWQDRRGLEQIAKRILSEQPEIAALIRTGREDTVNMFLYVYAEPALFFQLRLHGLRWGTPISHLKFAERSAPRVPFPVFAAVGPHALRDPRFEKQFETAAPQLELLGEYEYFPSDLVLLDEYHPHELMQSKGRRPPETIRLYRVK